MPELGKEVLHPNVVRTLDCDALGGHHDLEPESVLIADDHEIRILEAMVGQVPPHRDVRDAWERGEEGGSCDRRAAG